MSVSEEIMGIYHTSPNARPTASEMASILSRPVPSIRRTLNNLVSLGELVKFTEDGVVRFKRPEVSRDEKVCPQCGQTKNVEADFGFRGKAVQSWCKSCRSAESRVYLMRKRAWSRKRAFKVGMKVLVISPTREVGDLPAEVIEVAEGGWVVAQTSDGSKFRFLHRDARIIHPDGMGLVPVGRVGR